MLKEIIKENKFDKLDGLYSAWGIETMTLISNKYLEDYLGFYDIPCRSKEYLQYALYDLNVHNKFSYACGYSDLKDPFFRYLEDNK